MATDDDVSDTTKQVIAELDPGTVIDDMVLLSRRQVLGLATGTLSLGALASWGAGDASAQSVGSIGTDTERVDVFANDIDVNGAISPDAVGSSSSPADLFGSGNGNVALASDLPDVTSTSTADGFELTINGDTYQFNK